MFTSMLDDMGMRNWAFPHSVNMYIAIKPVTAFAHAYALYCCTLLLGNIPNTD
jgi:hypothetical protein